MDHHGAAAWIDAAVEVGVTRALSHGLLYIDSMAKHPVVRR